MSDRVFMLLYMGGFFAFVVALFSIITIRSTRKRKRVTEQFRRYLASQWTGQVTGVHRERVHQWWNNSNLGGMSDPHTLLRIEYRRDDGLDGAFHIARNEKTGRDSDVHAYHRNFSVYTSVPAPDPPPRFADVDGIWQPGDQLHKPPGAFFPVRTEASEQRAPG